MAIQIGREKLYGVIFGASLVLFAYVAAMVGRTGIAVIVGIVAFLLWGFGLTDAACTEEFNRKFWSGFTITITSVIVTLIAASIIFFY